MGIGEEDCQWHFTLGLVVLFRSIAFPSLVPPKRKPVHFEIVPLIET
jgi:hypothetical protein